MATKQVTIEGIGAVSIYKRKGNRTVRLSIRPNGGVRVSIPTWLPYAAGVKFATSRKDWIAQNRPTALAALVHGHRVGKAHRLSLEPHATDKTTTRLDGNEIRILYPLNTDPRSKAVQLAAEKAAVRALKKEAGSLLPQRLKSLAAETGFSYASVHVKRLKSRWGSCSSHREITLNIFLMQLPWHLIDYVLLHELVHTKVMQHGPPFWEEFEKHLPSAKARRREIRSHQPILTPFQT